MIQYSAPQIQFFSDVVRLINCYIIIIIIIWKAADVIPIPKIPRPRSIQTDIRPISLLPCLAKVLESIVGQWIRPILEPQFDPHQFGCRRNRSTTHALTAVLHAWQSTLDRGGAARAVLVDFKKAFDPVNHNLLLEKLFTRGVPHCLLKWFFSYTYRIDHNE